MRLIILSLVLISLTVPSFAQIKLRTRELPYKPKKEHEFFDLGTTSLEIGLNYANFKDGALQKTYEDFYRSNGAVMPSFRVTQFVTVGENFNLGLGFQFAYFRKKGPTMDESDNYTEENQILVYLPYQLFLDLNFTTEKGFDFDAWVGYKESFLENRREVAGGPAYISRKGKHWNSFVTVGIGSSFSLKEVGNPSFFTKQYPFGLRDILIKIYYESDFNLNKEVLFGNRQVLNNNNYEQRTFGLGFLFKL